jgi:hypothetical protein
MVNARAWIVARAGPVRGGRRTIVFAILLSALLPATSVLAGSRHSRSHHSHVDRHHHERARSPAWLSGPVHKELSAFPADPEPADPDACRLVLVRGFAVVTASGDQALPGAVFAQRGRCP